jgi:hypothetical protein
MLTLILPQTIQNRDTFVMMHSRSSTPTMAAMPWWIEHLYRLGTLASMLRWYVTDSAWWNMMTSHYLIGTLPVQSSRTMRSSSPCLNSWLMSEALQESAPPSSLSFHHISPSPKPQPTHPRSKTTSHIPSITTSQGPLDWSPSPLVSYEDVQFTYALSPLDNYVVWDKILFCCLCQVQGHNKATCTCTSCYFCTSYDHSTFACPHPHFCCQDDHC